MYYFLSTYYQIECHVQKQTQRSLPLQHANNKTSESSNVGFPQL